MAKEFKGKRLTSRYSYGLIPFFFRSIICDVDRKREMSPDENDICKRKTYSPNQAYTKSTFLDRYIHILNNHSTFPFLFTASNVIRFLGF